MFRSLIKSTLRSFGYDLIRYSSRVKIPMDERFLDVLADADFQASIDEIRGLTKLDTARLANLWELCRMTDPSGALIEVGSYKGGSALHISNSASKRTIFVCDTFEGFGALPLDPQLDRLFHKGQFVDANFEEVKRRWAGKERDVRWVRGYFPESAGDTDIKNISFAHIDLDIHKSTADTLAFLQPKFMDKTIVVFDDYRRGAAGVIKATAEFTAAHPEWAVFPIFPGQGLMISRSWF